MASIKRDDICKADILEEKLKLLHDCMEFGGTPPSLHVLLSSYQKEYCIFKETVKDKKITDNDKVYINALTELRKVLLGS